MIFLMIMITRSLYDRIYFDIIYRIRSTIFKTFPIISCHSIVTFHNVTTEMPFGRT